MLGGLLQLGMSTQLPGDQQRRMGSSSYYGQKMSVGGKRDKEEEDIAGALSKEVPTPTGSLPVILLSQKPQLPVRRHSSTKPSPVGRATEMCVDRTCALSLAECSGGHSNPRPLFLWPTSKIHNKAVQVIHKHQAALPLGQRYMDNSSPLSSGKKSLEKGPVVPQLVSCFFRCFLAPTLTPPAADNCSAADVTGSQQQSCQSVQEHSKGSATAFSRGSDTPSWNPPVSQLAGN